MTPNVIYSASKQIQKKIKIKNPDQSLLSVNKENRTTLSNRVRCVMDFTVSVLLPSSFFSTQLDLFVPSPSLLCVVTPVSLVVQPPANVVKKFSNIGNTSSLTSEIVHELFSFIKLQLTLGSNFFTD